MIAASGLRLTEHELDVPLHPGSDETLTVFAREVAAPEGLDKPFLVFLQGGPGFESPRPAGAPAAWLKRALQDFRVLLLDQRGTGRSGIAPTDAAARRPAALPRRRDRPRLPRPSASTSASSAGAVLGQSFGGLCV